MKIKNINLSLAILCGLVFLSFSFYVGAEEKTNTQNNIFLDSDQDGLTDEEERAWGTDPQKIDTDGDSYSDGAEVKSGYNPLKPAPGDKVIAAVETGNVLGEQTDENNLTDKVAQKISAMTMTAEEGTEEDGQVSMEQIQALVDEMTNPDSSAITLPDMKEEDIKIKKQKYGSLSEAEAEEKRKEDFSNYITAVFYIFSSNSPRPITSADDITTITSQISQEIISALDSRSSETLSDLNQSGQKIMEQLKDVEVPEELVSIHIKAYQYALYAQQLESLMTPDSEDPLQEIANFSKISAFVSSLSDFSAEVEKKFSEYGLTYDQSIKDKLEKLGIEPIEDENLLKEITE